MPDTHPTARQLPNRQSIRLPAFDYTRNVAYFITICTEGRRSHFGEIRDGVMHPSAAGDLVRASWDDLPNHHPRVELDALQIMPNHVHAVLWLTDVGATPASPERPVEPHVRPTRPHGPTAGSIAAVVGSFKSAVSRQINKMRDTPGVTLWQRDYFEHVIRDETALSAIREYIITNPARWERDRENPRGNGTDDVEEWVRTLVAPPDHDPRATQASPLRMGTHSSNARATQASPQPGGR
jgi:REP element-mobilizing transposase RayT